TDCSGGYRPAPRCFPISTRPTSQVRPAMSDIGVRPDFAWPCRGPLGEAMRRREFITLLGGAAATWPVAARAQQRDHMRLIGVLMGYADDDPAVQSYLAAFRAALAK